MSNLSKALDTSRKTPDFKCIIMFYHDVVDTIAKLFVIKKLKLFLLDCAIKIFKKCLKLSFVN